MRTTFGLCHRQQVQLPRVRQVPSPSAAEQDRRTEELLALREEHGRRALERPARLAAVRSGPALRDEQAAADCCCSCHPRQAQADLHAGGTSCPCQLTPEERKAAWVRFFASAADLGLGRLEDEMREDLQRRAAELGVTAELTLVAAPLVVSGRVDGRGFYLRERHGDWRVTIAADDAPGSDPWTTSPETTTLDIAEGTENELCDPDGRLDLARTLDVAVDAVRTYLLRRGCPHEQAETAEHRFCRRCGVRLAEAGAVMGAGAPDR